VSSLIYAGIPGGPAAVTLIAFGNARRLRMSLRAQIIGAFAAGTFYLLQRSYDRAYFALTDEVKARRRRGARREP
jgi:hypothetical protein